MFLFGVGGRRTTTTTTTIISKTPRRARTHYDTLTVRPTNVTGTARVRPERRELNGIHEDEYESIQYRYVGSIKLIGRYAVFTIRLMLLSSLLWCKTGVMCVRVYLSFYNMDLVYTYNVPNGHVGLSLPTYATQTHTIVMQYTYTIQYTTSILPPEPVIFKHLFCFHFFFRTLHP